MQSPDVVNAKIIEGYKLMLTFENGEKRIFDLEPYFKFPVFTKLKDRDELEKYEIVDGTVEWECGADLSPDTFYIESVPLNEQVNATL